MKLDGVDNIRSVMITGATGFVGRAIIKDLVENAPAHGSALEIRPVVRSCPAWLRDLAETGQIAEIVYSDFDGELTCGSNVDVIFHCATPASALLNVTSPSSMFALNVRAAQWVIESPVVRRNCPIVIFTSSGAVYGPQPEDLLAVSESFRGSPDVTLPASAYAEGKRAAEFLFCEAGARSVLRPRIARLFAFSGIGLPLDRHFALGNFVGNAIKGEEIVVRGSGRDVRSYLDVQDLVDWLMAIATLGVDSRPYNVGSDRPITIAELAELVADRSRSVLGNDPKVVIENRTSILDGASRYVPSTSRIREELGVRQGISLVESIDRMLSQ